MFMLFRLTTVFRANMLCCCDTYFKKRTKVLQILHICKLSGNFFEKKAIYRELLGYRTSVGSLLTKSCSIS